MNRIDPRRGMVLFELMIALVIFTVAAVAFVMALDAAMDAAKERNEIAAVVGGLDNQMALLHGAPIVPCDKDVPDDGSGIAYHLVIAPKQLQNQKNQPLPSLYEATVTATWKSEGQAENRSLTELLYQP